MKRVLAVLLLAAMLVGLAGCASWLPYEITVTHKYKGEATLRVNPITQTIRHGDDTYTYRVDGSTVRIHYPERGVYIVNLDTGYTGTENGPDTVKYLNEELLFSALTEDALALGNTAMVLVGMAFAIFGGWHLLLPRRSLIALGFGWGFWQTGETSRAKLGIRLAGVGMLLLGIAFILLA